MDKIWSKFMLLMWKNYKLQIRHPIQTLLEILAPVLFAVALVILRSLIPLEKYDSKFFSPFEPGLPLTANISRAIVWSPSNPILDKIINNTLESINEKNNHTILIHSSFRDRALLNSYLSNEINVIKTLAAIEFNDDLHNVEEMPRQINVTLRFPAELRSTLMSKYGTWSTNSLFPGYEPGPREVTLNEGGLPSYSGEGFLLLQQELSFSIIKHLKKTLQNVIPTLPQIYMQRFPYPSWTTDKLMEHIKSSVGIVFLLAYIYTSINIVKMITHEKERQLKEVMKIMGLPNWLLWTSWTLKFLISLIVTAVLMVIVLETGWYPTTNLSVFTHTDPNILFTFFICFSCATISFCFAISAFFTNASTAATFTGLLWFLSYVPYYFVDRFYSRYSFWQKMATCLCSNTAMAYGFRLILLYEGADVAIQWEDVWQFDSNEPTLGYIMIMLLFDAILYFIVGLYVEAVFPGNYGVPKKWYFLFSYTYWCGQSYCKEEFSFEEKPVENEQFEREPIHLQAGVKIKSLKKKFGNKVAVENLTLNMYQNQISVVLGHNGAGKTTTMSMLIGMFPPTSGTALVGGCDIRTNIKGARRSLGLCPQHNILFDELSVAEHIYFFSRLKGLDKDKISNEIIKYVKLLELESKENEPVSSLSGGMKRKVSVAIALCGNSEVVVLDEPTAGMDPSARRLLWDLLRTEKKGRTIILTTHFMDEADFLGDRIAIMSSGRLQCCGSSFFLKKKYGAGYHLIIDKTQDCNVDNVTMVLNKYIPNVKVESNAGSELVYLLNEEYSNTFQDVLHNLETSAQVLGINSYGISLTTLEEVFMKAGAEKRNTEDGSLNFNLYDEIYATNDSEISNMPYSSHTKLSKNEELFTGWRLWINQVQAMFMKRVLSICRTWILFVVQIIIPITFVIFIMIIILQASPSSNPSKLPITLEVYKNPVTLISTNRNNRYVYSYMKMLNHSNHTFYGWEDVDLNTKILEEMEKKPVEVLYQYIAGAAMHSNQSITGWFNNIPYHSAPLSLQLILNAILHGEISPDFSIQFFNHPLEYSFLNTELVSLMEGHSEGTTLALNIAFSMAFVTSFYVLFYIKERSSKAKHLQFVSGMNIIPFWVTSFVIDLLTFTITAACLIFAMAPFQIEGYSTVADLGHMLILLLVFGFAILPVMYLSAFIFEHPSSGYTRMTFFSIFNGVGAYLVIQILKSPNLNLSGIGNVLDWIFIIFPHYSLSDGINSLTKLNAINSICEAVIGKCIGMDIPYLPKLTRASCRLLVCQIESKCCERKTFLGVEPPGTLRNILMSISVGIFCFAILLCIEYEVFRKLPYKAIKKAPKAKMRRNSTLQEDQDVALEREKVNKLTQIELDNTSLVMQNVTKCYGNFTAVESISLMVNQYECFGLLGVNGAGKTTTFKMMTGDIKITSGNAWIYGLKLDANMKSIQRLIGYCPQFDALLDDLTTRETLVIFGLIRGLSRTNMKVIAEKLANDFNFYKHLDKKVKELSGGNKRKLSTSLALIGDPLILYLDEPTTGMDPATKRYLWNCICKVRDTGKCIVLTSHSMEECEALCTRLGIMVNGRLMCLGSTQRLKNKFSSTYTLTIKIKRTGAEEQDTKVVENFVTQNFPKACLREKHKELLIFSINDNRQRWSEMFGLMERAKQSLNMEDYSLGQGSLEQVFLRLTKYQTDD